ncbi:MAG: hypothetical protein WD342_01110 [Verrucomicrobiales bacterium]
MDIEEAKFILSAVPPGRIDESSPATPSDPEVAKALRMVENDPALKEWYERSRRFDAAVAERLQEIEPPADLKASILAGLRVTPTPLWRRGPVARWSAVAAVLAVGLLVGTLVDPGTSTPDGGTGGTLGEFQGDMLEEVRGLDGMDFQSNDPAAVAAWLRSRELDPGSALAAEANGHALVGCKIVQWKGYRVSLVCFRLAGEEGMPGLHVMTMDAAALETPSGEGPQFASDGTWSAATWRDDDRVYFLAAKGEHADPRGLLSPG